MKNISVYFEPIKPCLRRAFATNRQLFETIEQKEQNRAQSKHYPSLRTYNLMKKYISLPLFALALLVSCGKPDENSLEGKKALLAEKQKLQQQLDVEIGTLTKEIAAMDSVFAQSLVRYTLVTTIPVDKSTFTHYAEVTGTVESDKNIIISPEIGGTVEKMYVEQGQTVKAGQVLAKMDDLLIRKQIAELKVALDLAKTIFEKQENLWKEKIGTEVQYLQAKTNKESLESRLSSANAQLSKTLVKAPFSGTVQTVFAKEGEMAAPGMPLLQMADGSDSYVEAEVAETYIGKVKKGDSVTIEFPSIQLTKKAVISSVGDVIKPDNRTFKVQVNLPKNLNAPIKPKMLAILTIKDYVIKDAVTVPVNLIQREKGGEFVFIAAEKDGKLVAKRVNITRGDTYQGKTVIKEGLQGGEQLINEGFREVAENSLIKVTAPIVTN
jgi:RND family efflux transporter MFP subunit